MGGVDDLRYVLADFEIAKAAIVVAIQGGSTSGTAFQAATDAMARVVTWWTTYQATGDAAQATAATVAQPAPAVPVAAATQ